MEHTEEYDSIHLPRGWGILHMPVNLGICGAMRHIFDNFPDQPFYGLICDDEFIETQDWDKQLIAAAGRMHLAHANNGDTSKVNPHGFMTFGGDLVRAVGCLAPKGLWHWYIDAFWEIIIKRCDLRIFCKDVLMTEVHHKRGTAPYDETYQAGERLKDEDQKWFIDWLRDPSSIGMKAMCDRVNNAKRVG